MRISKTILIWLTILVGTFGCNKVYYRVKRNIQPDNVSQALAHYEQGLTFERNGDTELAIKEYTKANELSPRPAAYYRLGLIYAAKAEYSRAIAQFEKALELVPTYFAAQQELNRIKSLSR
ncbi:MAG: tetratricopeptide repeat protein [bacterium]|nr:tetratricopeptide repeat protein [bacterium]